MRTETESTTRAASRSRKRLSTIGLLALVAALSTLVPRAAHAEVPPEPIDPNHSPFRVNVPLDIGISVGSMVLGGMPRLFASEAIRPWCGLECDPADVNPLDRTVIGHHSKTALHISDAGFFSSMALPYAFGLIDALTSDPTDGFTGMAKDDLVLIETLSIVLVTNNVFSFIIRRPRPITYDKGVSDEERLLPNNTFSFPSGHTAASFAMATAYSRLYMMRHPDSPWIAPLWIGTYSLATMTGVLRTYSGDHFWTDVMAGAITGIGLGLVVPWMHTVELESGPQAQKATAINVRVAPMALEGGAGATLILQ